MTGFWRREGESYPHVLSDFSSASLAEIPLRLARNPLRVLVPGGGIEPPWCHHRGILSPVRLPIPPSRLADRIIREMVLHGNNVQARAFSTRPPMDIIKSVRR